jgi:exopolysaccharide biosynthesis protein
MRFYSNSLNYLLRPLAMRCFLLILLFSLSPLNQRVTGQHGKGFEKVAPGVEHLLITRGFKSNDVATGPWLINLLRVDPNRAELRAVHALDEAIGLETTSSLVARYGAFAAVNGGYFATTGTYRGDPAGALVVRGKILSEPVKSRAAAALINENGKNRIILGHLVFQGSVRAGRNGVTRIIDGINRTRGANELIVYTAEFHRTTLTTPDGIEVVIRRGRVTGRRGGQGSARIPYDGYVISASGDGRDWAQKNLPTGKSVTLDLNLSPVERGSASLWKQAVWVVGGGPQLIKNGRVEITAEMEGVTEKFVTDRHPRTAIARLEGGKILLATVDGRQAGVSVGVSLGELAKLLLEFGATEAINLDGGGSTTMIVAGKLVSKPSDASGERAVSDAILIFPRGIKK